MALSPDPAFDARSPYRSVRERTSAKRMGMYWFLGALAILFVSSVLAYVWMRVFNPLSPPFGVLAPPAVLWVSTVALLASSGTIHQALVAIRREQQTRFQRWLIATVVLTTVFFVSQFIAIGDLLALHFDPSNFSGKLLKMPLFGFIVALIVLHGLHVLGGLIPMGVVMKKAFTGGYDHESYAGVIFFAMYWHFLDLVWLCLFGLFAVESLAPLLHS